MSRPTGWLTVWAFFIAGALASFVCARAFAAPQALAIEDFTNTTGDDNLDWLRFSLPQALAECVWQMPGVAGGPATDCDPKPHAKFWVYRTTEAQKRLRAQPPPEWYRAGLHDAIAQGLSEQDPLDLPANPDVLVTGSIAKAGGALEVTLKVAAASGETVSEVRVTAPVEKAIITVPEEVAWTLRPLLSNLPTTAVEARPSLGTKSAEAAQAYLEARFWLMSKAVEVLNKGVKPREMDASKSGRPAAERERDLGKSFDTGREHAITSLTRAISLDQTFVLPHTSLGALYLGLAVAARHTTSSTDIVFPPRDPTEVAAAASAEAKSLPAARKEYETAVRLGDGSPDVLTSLAATLIMEAQAAVSSGDAERGKALLDRSIQVWMDALRAEPESVSIRMSAGGAYLQRALGGVNKVNLKIVDREAFGTAMKLMREAVKLAPDCKRAKDLLRDTEWLQAQ